MLGRTKTVLSLVVIICVVLVVGSVVRAEIPTKINYQVRLADVATGEPLEGSHNLTFRIYDASAGGAHLWSESQTLEADSAGVISAILGRLSPIELAFDAPTWLEVEVDGEVLSPRREIVSVAYAFRALHADSLAGFSAEDFVVAGEAGSITVEMIVGGSGSGLDADMVDGLDAAAFSDTGHVHDDRYLTEAELSGVGTVNDTLNPVDWTRLKNVPEGFADGTDDGGNAGDNHSLDAADGEPEDAVYVDADGHVGIGTVAPQSKLEVAGTVHSVAGGFKFPDGTVQSTAVSGVEVAGGWVDDSTVVRLEDPADSVGIGTGTPAAKLDVLGTVKMEGFKLPSDTSYGYVLTSDSSGVGTWQAAADGHSLDSPNGFYKDVVYVDNSGDVGIGTDDPSGALNIYGDENGQVILTIENPNTGSASGERISFRDENGDICAIVAHDDDSGYPNQLRILNNRPDGTIALIGAPVGINESNPEERLHVGGTVRMTGFKLPTGAASGHILTSDASGTGTWQPPAFGDGHSLDAVDGDPVDVVYVDENGYVGIGMDPEVALDIHAPYPSYCYLRLTHEGTGTGLYDGTRFFVGPGGHARIMNYETASLDFGTDNQTRMTIDSDGNVGIGTYNPVNLLHVHESATGGSHSRFTNSVTGSTVDDGFLVGIDDDGDAQLLNLENKDLSIGTNGAPAIKIESTGQVGIGTGDPSLGFHLHKAGGSSCQMLMTNEFTGSTHADGLRLEVSYSPGNAYITNFETADLNLGAGGYIATLTVDQDQKIGINEDEPNYELQIHRHGTDTDCNMQMTNYTIGNTATDGLLMGINKNGFGYLTNQENGYLILGTNNQGWLAIASDGDVGIGTLNPNDRLHLHHSTASEACFQRWTNSATGALYDDGFKIGIDASGHAYIHNYEDTAVRVATNNHTRMIVEAGGDVGIGDDNPSVKLAVTGVARIQDLAAWPTQGKGMELAYDAGLHRGYIQVFDRDGGGWGKLSLGSGNVGIGTGNPAEQLEVKGIDPYIGLNTTNNKTGLKLQKNGATEWEIAWNEGSGYLYFYNAGTRMVIEDATGDVGIGTGTPGYKLQVGNTGDGTEARANAWNTFSSREYKTGIRELSPTEYQGILDDIRKTDVVRYRYRDDEKATEHIGVIAEEAPADITTPDRKAVELSDYSAFLLAAIKAQQDQIEVLQAQVEQLQTQLTTQR